MVVEADPERRHQLCALLANHGLSVHPVHSDELAMAVQGWSGIILVGNGHDGTTGWELAERIRTFDARVPIILLGSVKADPSATPTMIQACLPAKAPEDLLLKEVERWLRYSAPPSPIKRFGTILLTDDDGKLRQILKNFLELKGFTVLTAGSGEEALEHLDRVVPKVVLLDVKMPGMDGLSTLKHIRLTHPNLPVIFITHLDGEEVMEEAEILGAHDYLIKPFNFEHLEAILLTKIFA